MKIVCSKRDEILKRKAEYEESYNARKALHNEQYQRYMDAEQEICSEVKTELESVLSRFTALTFVVQVSRHFSNGLDVRVLCNEYNKFEDNSALSWSYYVSTDRSGELTRETSSWSGLKATTAEQIESLEQTVEALKYLNTVDWKSLLDKTLPKYTDYVTEDDPRYDRNKPNFDQELLEADLEECIGAKVLVKGTSAEGTGSGYREGVRLYYMIHRETPAQYVVTDGPAYYIDNLIKEQGNAAAIAFVAERPTYRIKKSTLLSHLTNPLETLK